LIDNCIDFKLDSREIENVIRKYIDNNMNIS